MSVHPIIPLGVCLALAAVAAARFKGLPAAITGRAGRGVKGLAATVLVLLLLVLGYQTLSPVWLSHLQSSITVHACFLLEGAPLYPDPDAPQRTGQLYGPILYAGHALAMLLLGKSTLATKLIDALLVLSALALVSATARRLAPAGRPLALLYTAGMVLAFNVTIYLGRAEPPLIFLAAVGVWACLSGRKWPAALLLGAATGLALNIKIHAFAYLLPCWALYLHRQGWKGTALALAAGAATAVLPFAALGLSFPNYISLVTGVVARKHPLPTIFTVLEYSAFLAAPPLLAAAMVRARQPGILGFHLRRHVPLAAASAAAAAIVFIPATNLGAGQNHLIPFLPLAALVLAKLADLQARTSSPPPAPRWIPVAAMALTAALVAAAAITSFRAVNRSRRDLTAAAPLIADLRDLLHKNPGLTVGMGCGSDATYRQTWYQTELAYAGQPCLIDPAALMDMQKAGQAIPESTLACLRRGEPNLWLIPRGEKPFSMHGYLTRRPPRDLFDARFQAVFAQCYALSGRSPCFDLYRPRPTTRAAD